jgi:hypothetical protein
MNLLIPILTTICKTFEPMTRFSTQNNEKASEPSIALVSTQQLLKNLLLAVRDTVEILRGR